MTLYSDIYTSMHEVIVDRYGKPGGHVLLGEAREQLKDAIWAENAMRDEPNGDTRYLVGRFEQACKALGRYTGDKRETWMTNVRSIVNVERAVEVAS